MEGYRALLQREVEEMGRAGCTAQDWSGVQVGGGFDPKRVRDVCFVGQVRLGSLSGDVEVSEGVRLPSEVSHATLVDCDLADNVRVTRIGSHVANYTIGTGAVVSDVGTMVTRPGATFGNGVQVCPVNEGGGREVAIFNEMSSQFAYLACMHRYLPDLVAGLNATVETYTAGIRSDRGCVGPHATIAHVPWVEDLNVGSFGRIVGATRLRNGTVLSEREAPTTLGAGVIAEDFIVAEGSIVDGGALLSRAFVGQGVQIGKGFSGENVLLFANSECFHGEACSVFGGPYTVTHHKSTLLIAGIYSFFNAGSGTNQSNHMYKLGPVHQGILERGSKMGSFSYMLWPSVIGPFSVVIGKHMSNFSLGDLPFSYITEEGGGSFLTPGMNLSTVGTIRDGQKWPSRDRRKGSVLRDLIRFEVFSPFTVGRMIRGEKILSKMQQETPRDVESVRHGGASIKRLLLRPGARSYASAIDAYLQGKILQRAEPALDGGAEALRLALAERPNAVYSEDWADVSGLLISRARLSDLEKRISSGEIGSTAAFDFAFRQAWEAYEPDEWAWIRRTYQDRFGRSVDSLSPDDLHEMGRVYRKTLATGTRRTLADAEKEFGETARVGYGADGSKEQGSSDFEAVRGNFDGNSFVRQMRSGLEEVSGG